ncbi:hypothetical protein DU19_0225 [Chlamydia muridarum]|jgi:hypothetical protein|uniref:Uncharacterized protein n=1 Tax=Chlamydia muridarum (strain MoPn / Nigg) TaxID=243161 RepID=Q9PLA9_CHLMU|nr:hypothetical protein TC_0198 [Chlamydia muridarum str. Nigg]AHH22590.1 hypothetical protein TAC_01045 [Chlamydia muridarum str. Nigg3 CMUT3-5]AHH23514.1 hypothetical protein Y015_01045 [Chlamydia muridarum str. Nigg CM972]KDU80320.1 hypothetical protein DU17_0225 [Chlamydia muridarum]KDU81196.1 hypothetical protein DU18_0226 [Chlamydia muridarum]
MDKTSLDKPLNNFIKNQESFYSLINLLSKQLENIFFNLVGAKKIPNLTLEIRDQDFV